MHPGKCSCRCECQLGIHEPLGDMLDCEVSLLQSELITFEGYYESSRLSIRSCYHAYEKKTLKKTAIYVSTLIKHVCLNLGYDSTRIYPAAKRPSYEPEKQERNSWSPVKNSRSIFGGEQLQWSVKTNQSSYDRGKNIGQIYARSPKMANVIVDTYMQPLVNQSSIC